MLISVFLYKDLINYILFFFNYFIKIRCSDNKIIIILLLTSIKIFVSFFLININKKNY